MSDIAAKWDQIYSQRQLDEQSVSVVLSQNAHLLPASGIALDLACGMGADSLFLAQKGLKVTSWDCSSVAISGLRKKADEKNVAIDAQIRDVIAHPPSKHSVDIMVVSHFLVRNMAEQITDALKPHGLLFYQTFCRTKVSEQGPKNRDYLLEDNELLRLFSALKLRVYREESVLGDPEQGWRNRAMLVAEKG